MSKAVDEMIVRTALNEAATRIQQLTAENERLRKEGDRAKFILGSMMKDAERYLDPDNECCRDWFINRTLWHLRGGYTREAIDAAMAAEKGKGEQHPDQPTEHVREHPAVQSPAWQAAIEIETLRDALELALNDLIASRDGGRRMRRDTLITELEAAIAVAEHGRSQTLPCPRDTNGDGDCGGNLCPHCGTEGR